MGLLSVERLVLRRSSTASKNRLAKGLRPERADDNTNIPVCKMFPSSIARGLFADWGGRALCEKPSNVCSRISLTIQQGLDHCLSVLVQTRRWLDNTDLTESRSGTDLQARQHGPRFNMDGLILSEKFVKRPLDSQRDEPDHNK